MRFVPVNVIREGMVNAKTLYGRNEEVLLREGTPLNTHIIRRVYELGHRGIYVEDHSGDDFIYHEIIDQKLRIEAVGKIKKAYLSSTKSLTIRETAQQKEDLGETIDKLIDEILDNKHLMLNMVDLKVFDDYTFYHSVNVTVISLVIAVAMELDRKNLYQLGLAALLHDVGKIIIPREIHDKPGKLTPEEFEIMKSHSEEGFKYLKEVYNVPLSTYMAVKFHHERFDGEGYPLGLIGSKIPLFSRIITVADVFDALTSDRVYRKALSPSEAMEYIMSNSQKMFDPEIVRIFTRKVAPYPPGTIVELSDKRIAVVVETYEGLGLRPLVKVIREGGVSVEPYNLDLKEDRLLMNLTIIDVYNDSDIQ